MGRGLLTDWEERREERGPEEEDDSPISNYNTTAREMHYNPPGTRSQFRNTLSSPLASYIVLHL